MKPKDFFRIFAESAKDLYKNPSLVLPPSLLLITLFVFSKISAALNYKLQNSLAMTSWLVAFSLISLALVAFFFSALIGMSKEAVNKKLKIRHFANYSSKFWLKNLLVILIILLCYNAIRFIAHYSALFIGKSLSLGVNPARIIFFLIFIAGLLLTLIFLTFTNFILITKNLPIKKSLNASIKLVRKNYIYTLSIILLFFVINQLLTPIKYSYITEIANALIFVPYLALILTRFILLNDEK